MNTGISLNNITSGALSEDAANLIWKIASSNLSDEQKERAYESAEKAASFGISDCNITMKESSPRLTVWQWLGIAKS